MSMPLKYVPLFSLILIIAATPLALADPLANLAEQVPATTTTSTTIPPPPNCNPIDCGGGNFACDCQFCCPNSPLPCYETGSSSVLQTALDGGCTPAPGNSCGNCPAPQVGVGPLPPSQSCVWVVTAGDPEQDVIQNLKQEFTFSGSAALPSCLTQYLDQTCQVGVSFVVGGDTNVGGDTYPHSYELAGWERAVVELMRPGR